MTDNQERFADFRPDRNVALHPEERSRFLPILFGVVAVVSAIGYGGYYFYTNSETFNQYKQVYDRLGIELPRSFERVVSWSRLPEQNLRVDKWSLCRG